ncbi:MAG: acyl-CoA dehydrogenase family protein [Bacteriovoracaceae bacterium]
MAKYQTDLEDIYFNLFSYLKIQNFAEGMEEADLKEVIREYDKFVENEVYKTRILGDVEGVKLEDGKVSAPKCFKPALRQFHDNGWFGLGFTEDVGGIPAPNGIDVACTSLLNGANVAFSMYPGLSKAALNVILKVGSDAQKERYVANMMAGTWGGTMCLTEPGAGSDVGAAKTTATPNDDGTYSIQGNKIFISSGDNDLYENIVHLVLARTPGAPEGTKGLSLFLVPKTKINDDGSLGEANNVSVGKIEEKMGIHGSATCEMVFGDSGECLGTLIGKEFHGMVNMFIMMNEARLLCGIQGESQANLAYELSRQYASERSQFNTAIQDLPDVRRLLLKMRSLGRGMRALSLYTASLFDRVKAGEKELEAEIALLTPVCKGFCTEEGFTATVDAVQIHGGYGYCSEYGIEQFVRDSKIATIYEGTSAIQAMDFVTRKILKDEGKTLQKVFDRIKESTKKAKSLFPDEGASIELVEQSLNDSLKILGKFHHWSKESPEKILFHSFDFLMFCGRLFVGHLLLDQAILAKESVSDAAATDKTYFESKQDDFFVFAQHYLTQNLGVSTQICEFEAVFHSI